MKLLRIECVLPSIGYKSKTSIYGDIKSGTLTAPVKLGKRSVGWPDYEIDSICRARIAGWSNDQIRVLVDQLHSKRQDVNVLN